MANQFASSYWKNDEKLAICQKLLFLLLSRICLALIFNQNRRGDNPAACAGLQKFYGLHVCFQVHMPERGAQIYIDLAMLNCYQDLYEKVEEIFRTGEELLTMESIWRFFYVDQFYNIKTVENESWEQFCMAARKIFIYQTEVIDGLLNMRTEDTSQESGGSEDDIDSHGGVNI